MKSYGPSRSLAESALKCGNEHRGEGIFIAVKEYLLRTAKCKWLSQLHSTFLAKKKKQKGHLEYILWRARLSLP